jgi:hypothetical protein
MAARKKKSDWPAFLQAFSSVVVRGVPAVAAIERDGRLIRDALTHVALAANFPMRPALDAWRKTEGKLLGRVVDALPEILESREVRAWLEKWARGEGHMVTLQ